MGGTARLHQITRKTPQILRSFLHQQVLSRYTCVAGSCRQLPGSQSFNSIFPTTVSPWDIRTTAGGSSGGSAAALVSYQCWLATGTDLGGSLRIPAAFCGAVGFWVSPGRTPGQGYGPLLGLHGIAGPMARSIRDAALFLDAMESNTGWDKVEPHSPRHLDQLDQNWIRTDQISRVCVDTPNPSKRSI